MPIPNASTPIRRGSVSGYDRRGNKHVRFDEADEEGDYMEGGEYGYQPFGFDRRGGGASGRKGVRRRERERVEDEGEDRSDEEVEVDGTRRRRRDR